MRRKYRKFFKNAMKAGVMEASKIEIRGKVTAGLLNIRQKPTVRSKVVGQARRNSLLLIVNREGDWYQVVYDGKNAFVFAKYIEILRNENKATVNTNNLNIRSQPNSDSEILGVVNKGDKLKILKKHRNWDQIDYNGKAAFVYNKYLDYPNQDSTSNTSGGGGGGNTPPSTGDYFYKREDLAKIKLEPEKLLPEEGSSKEKKAARTWNAYGGLLSFVAKELDFDVKSALSILCVESGGKGFSNGKMLIRFEVHVFDMYWGKDNEEKFKTYFDYKRSSRRHGHKFRTEPKGEWEDPHTGQSGEWKIFEFARTISEKHAIYSISMGAAQIMGFNYKSIGYSSPQEMFKYFSSDIRYHVLAFFDFCKYRPQRIEYLRKNDFYSFSREYNGATDPSGYEKRMLEYYDIYKKLL